MSRGGAILIGFLILLGIAFILKPPITGFALNPGACEDNQVILRLSDTTNAHGERFNGAGNYPVKVCYDEFFSGSGDGTRACGSNKIVSLSSSTNAHGEDPLLGNYPEDICYGDLSCSVRGPGEPCGAGEVAIVSLSDTTNAHLSLGEVYDYKVCCSSDSGNSVRTAPPVGSTTSPSPRWEDYSGAELSESYIGNIVKLVVLNSGILPGEKIMLRIVERDLVSDDLIRDVESIVNSDGSISGEWEITQADFDIGKTGESTLEFRFSVFVEDSSNPGSFIPAGIDSPDLTVTDGVADPVDNYPDVSITGLAEGDTFTTSGSIPFSFSGSDNEGPLSSILWEFGDGTSSTEVSPTHSYSQPGQYEVTLTVSDSTGNIVVDQISILVLEEGVNIFASINSPGEKKIITSDSYLVPFSDADSYAVNIVLNPDGSVLSAECLAGNCPASTGSGVSVDDPNLNRDNYAQLFYNWTFSQDGSKVGNIEGPGLTDGNAQYPDSGEKSIELVLTYPGEGGDSQEATSRTFTLLDTRQCVDSGFTWLDVGPEGNILASRPTTGSDSGISYYCEGADGITGGSARADDCCPSGWQCTGNGGGCAQAVTANDLSLGCAVYDNLSPAKDREEACDDDWLGIETSKLDPSWNEANCGEFIDGNIISCFCVWDVDTDTCNLEAINSSITGDSNLVCGFSSNVLECTSGNTQRTEITVTGPAGCGSDYTTDPVACSSYSVELPFFGISQLIFSIVSIFFLYLLVLNKREE